MAIYPRLYSIEKSMKKPRQSRIRDDSADLSPSVTYSVPAGTKTIDVIEYMAQAQAPQTKSEIAAGIGKSIQEVYRIIQLLVARGYLVSEDNGNRFSLSMKLFSLVHTMPSVRSLSEASVGPMRRLASEVNQSCHLGVLWDAELLVVSQINSPLNMSYSVALGARFPAHETSSGLVLLAGLEPQRLERLLAIIESRMHTEEDIENVRKHVAEVSRVGHDLRPSLMVPGITNISYPVFGLHGETLAVLTIPFLAIKRSTLPLQQTAIAASHAAQEISQAMGYPLHFLKSVSGSS